MDRNNLNGRKIIYKIRVQNIEFCIPSYLTVYESMYGKIYISKLYWRIMF